MASETSSSVWLPSLVLAVVGVTGYLVHQNAFQTSRPAEKESWSKQLAKEDDVEARLWQDPFLAVNEHVKNETTEQEEHHQAAKVAPRIDRAIAAHRKRASANTAAPENSKSVAHSSGHDLTVLAVMVPQAPYAEPAERRRRIRYAVLSGLARSGWVVEDQEHLSFFKPNHKLVNSASRVQLPTFVPYEFLKRNELASSGELGSGPSVLLLWIATESSQSCPANTVAQVLTELVPKSQVREHIKFVVIGPPDSGTLAELLRESIRPQDCAGAHGSALIAKLSVYSPWASAADLELARSLGSTLLDALPQIGHDDRRSRSTHYQQDQAFTADFRACADAREDCDISRLVGRRLENFTRLNPDDVALSEALLNELQKRGVDPTCIATSTLGDTCPYARNRNGDHRIAIVSEWDAPYQRSLRETLSRTIHGRCVASARQSRVDCPAEHQSDWLLPFSYLRGVDGQTADALSPDKPKAARAKSTDALGEWAKDDAIERADGNRQFDYVRRLAA
ncbi:MAG: hypothetical protein ABI612_01115 [Betaproteobacteria bacterium]